MKKIFSILLTILFAVAVMRPVFADEALHLGTFTLAPTAPSSSPTSYIITPNVECKLQIAEDKITRMGGPDFEEKHRGLMEKEIKEYLRNCTDPNEGCTKDENTLNTNTQRIMDIIHEISKKIFGRDEWIYAKTLARYAMRQGFGLSNDGLKKMVDSFDPACPLDLGNYVSTPIYFYPENNMDIQLSIASSPSYIIRLNKNGTLKYGNNFYSSVQYGISSSGSVFPKPGRLVEKNQLNNELSRMTEELNFTQKEKNDFIAYWLLALPEANYYSVSLLDRKEAEAVAPWTVEPLPATEIRYIFYFKPSLEKPQNVLSNISFTSIERKGFTVVDIGGIIDW